MSTQLDLLELASAQAIAARDEGMELVLDNDLNAEYRDRLLASIEILAMHDDPFTADDARELAGDPPRSTHPNIAGAVFNAAAKVGIIRQVGFGCSRRAKGHNNLVRIWRGVHP